MAERIPILVYHRVHHPDDVTVPNDGGRVDLPEFERQMDTLKKRGVQTVTHAQIAAWLLEGAPLPERAVGIDFDDNRSHVLENAFPIMRERGFTGTVWVITDLADGATVPGLMLYPAMDWKALTELRDAGWCIGSHTRQHLFLAGMENAPDIAGAAPAPQTEQELLEELTGSRQAVERHMGSSAPYFAYPGGSWNEEVERHVRSAYDTARVWCAPTAAPWPVNTKHTDPYRLSGINVASYLSFDAFCEIVDEAA